MKKDWIEKNCFTKSGTFNNRCTLKSWWINRGLLDELKCITTMNRPSITEALYLIYNNCAVPVCPVCGNPTKFINFKSGFYTTCSTQCSYKSTQRNDRISHTNKANADQRNGKRKQTCLTRYGVEEPLLQQEIQQKMREKKVSLYGSLASAQNTEKRRQTCLDRYGVEDPLTLYTQQEKMRQAKLEKYGTLCFNFGSKSKMELEIKSFINSVSDYRFDASRHTLPNGQELDMFCEELSLAIEFCGLYWHSEIHKPNNYHYNKYKMCEELGIRLITIFEDEWLTRQDQVKNFLKGSVGIFDRRLIARKCTTKTIEKKIALQFINNYHIQSCVSSKHATGLFFEDELVGVLCVNNHHRKTNIPIINRVVFKPGVQVVGGLSKMIKHAMEALDINSITTWSDNRWSIGNAYMKAGFIKTKTLYPDYSYYKSGDRLNRVSKQSQQKKLTGCPAGMTEHQWANKNNLFQIYDCGKIQWTFNRK